MSLDERLRDGLPRMASEVDPEVEPTLHRVVQGGRRRRTLYRAGAVLATAAVVVAAAVGIPRALEAVRGEAPPVGFGTTPSPSPERTPAEPTPTVSTLPTPTETGAQGGPIVLAGRCAGELGFEPTYLPEGFSPEPVLGPAPGSPYPAEQGQGVVHWTDGERSVEIRRPGLLFVEIVQEEGAPTIIVLGEETSGIGPVVPNYEEGPAGEDFMVQFRFPAGQPSGPDSSKDCGFHSVTEYGLDRDEVVRVAEGLRRTS